jgi:hypothetical protein
MLRFSSKIIIIIMLGFLFFTLPAPKAKAMEPISMAMMLAPIVIPIIKAALPYMIKGAVNMGGAMFEVGVEMFRMIYIPLGFFEITFGAPFGLFQPGLINLRDGAIAFPMMFVKMCAVPFKTVGAM